MTTKIYSYLVIIIFFAIILGSSIPSVSIPSSYIFTEDKLLHIVEYFILGFFLFNSLTEKTKFPGLLCLLLGGCFAIVDEIYQSTVFGRIPSSFDVIADLVGLTLHLLYNKIFTKNISS